MLRILAFFVVGASVLGYVLLSFWDEQDDGFPGENLRERVGNLLTFVWAPAALGGVVYTAALLVSLYAARIELGARRLDRNGESPPRGERGR